MKNIAIIFSLLVLLLGSFGFLTVKSLKYSGSASDIHSGEFYYSEEHEEMRIANKPSETRILYKDKSGKIIVKKTIDYSKSLLRPEFLQEDLRDGYTEGAKVINGSIQLIHRKNNKSKLETKILKIPGVAVIDGGFNYFVKENWDKLFKGEMMKFNFVVPSKLDFFAFRISRVKEETVNDHKVMVFKLEPDQFVIRALVAPIILKYNVATKRLCQYEGLSTINDHKGKSYKVRIVYPVTGP
jgi:hypothetical protein